MAMLAAPARCLALLAVLVAGGKTQVAGSEPTASAPGLSAPQIAEIRDSYPHRAAQILGAERGRPLVRQEIRPPLGRDRVPFVRNYAFTLVGFAARALWWQEDDVAANAALRELADHFLTHPERIYDKDNFHWHSEAQLRLLEFFGTAGRRRRGAITPETERRCLEAIWLYCKRRDADSRPHAHLATADDALSGTWWIEESENHHAQSFTTLWHFAQLARQREDFRARRYDDGRTAAEHHADWNRYLRRYVWERARKGMFIEMMSVTYNAHLLKGFFNVHDFAEDPELRRAAGQFLDLYFAYWGQEQLAGIAGGGRARLYTDIGVPASALGYVFFGLGPPPRFRCDLFTALTTDYRPDPIVVDLACDRRGRGTYEVVQRPLGLAASSEHHAPPHYRLRTDDGGILRYAYCTPDFILGTAMHAARPADAWTMISSQNRRHGVIFASHPAAAILPQCEYVRGERAYNTQWSVQRKGTILVQKLRTHVDAGRMRIWFAGEGLSAPREREGWIFVTAGPAFAAVRVARGSFRWERGTGPVPGQWLYPDDEFAPVILEVAGPERFPDLATFAAAVLAPRLRWDGEVLHLRGLSGDAFTFPADQTSVPQINGTPLDYAPARAFDSPFLQAEWDTGVVTVQKGGRQRVLDFRIPP
jgi:hypothetical protein